MSVFSATSASFSSERGRRAVRVPPLLLEGPQEGAEQKRIFKSENRNKRN